MAVASSILSKSLSELASESSSNRLEQIARLRAHGIAELISLPQLVVCGAQSTGKSSVIEGLTGIPFPRHEGVCTTFVTEVTLQHTDDEQVITATIIPDPARPPESQKALRDFRKTLRDFEELPQMIEQAGIKMGVKPHCKDESAKELVSDILSIKLEGPTGLHLTLVDLPGLTGLTRSSMPTEKAEIARSLVKKYLANSRTIALAVLPANADVELQDIIGICRELDPQGDRSLGIITKPDLINKSAAKTVASLAKNEQKFRFRLGYYIVKNPSPDNAKQTSAQEAEEAEEKFFSEPPWNNLGIERNRIGIRALRSALQSLLDRHMQDELPKVRDEIREAISSAEHDMLSLGEERKEPKQMRAFLTLQSMRYRELSIAAIDGHYRNQATFFEPPVDAKTQDSRNRRLRSGVQKENSMFAERIRSKGSKRCIVSKEQKEAAYETQSAADDTLSDAQLFVTEEDLYSWVKETYEEARAIELPGMRSATLLSELFSIQSRRWLKLSHDHLSAVHNRVMAFVVSAIRHIAGNDQSANKVLQLVGVALEKRRAAAENELQRLREDEEAPPMTYDPNYFTTYANKQAGKWNELILTNARIAINEQQQADAQSCAQGPFSGVYEHIADVACTSALQELEAYYEVALTTFVDNVCRQVIERNLLRGLPDIFSPSTVVAMSDDELKRYGSEEPEQARRRESLRETITTLKEGLADLWLQ